MHELNRSLCKRAKAVLDLPSVADAHTGVIAAVQRTDSGIRLNVHFHVLALDGVYVRDATSDALVFHTLPTPTHAEVADIARRTAGRIDKILRAHGRSLDPAMQDDEPPKLCSDEPGLAACYAAAARGVAASGDRAGQAPLRLLVSPAQVWAKFRKKTTPSLKFEALTSTLVSASMAATVASWSAFAGISHALHRAFIWCAILVFSQATPSSVPKSSLSHHRILPLSSRLRLRATSLSSPSSTPKLTPLGLPVNVEPGYWLMCSGQILTLVCTAAGPCAGLKPPPPYKLPPHCSPGLGDVLGVHTAPPGVLSGYLRLKFC